MKELTIEAKTEHIPTVANFVAQQLEALNCPPHTQSQINIAIDELFGNIAHYAYRPAVGMATVRVEVAQSPLTLIITFIDSGIPYDPLRIANPDITLSSEERPIGGLGIYLVKKTMDELSYAHKNGQNILTIKKRI